MTLHNITFISDNESSGYVNAVKDSFSSKKNVGGYLEKNANGDLTFIKYKEQFAGRMNILAWLVYKLVMLFRKDKTLFTIAKKDILEKDFTEGKAGGTFGIGGVSGLLKIKTESNVYSFATGQIAPDVVNQIIAD